MGLQRLEDALALALPAKLLIAGLASHRTLTDETPRLVEVAIAASATEGRIEVVDGLLELGTATGISAVMTCRQ
jgi:hypothetical protein